MKSQKKHILELNEVAYYTVRVSHGFGVGCGQPTSRNNIESTQVPLIGPERQGF